MGLNVQHNCEWDGVWKESLNFGHLKWKIYDCVGNYHCKKNFGVDFFGRPYRSSGTKTCLDAALNRKYVGQTGRSVYERIGEEVRGWHNRDEKNPLWRHSELYHEGREFEYEVKITNRDFGRPSRRLITEGVLIEKLDEGKTMNSKREWTYTNLTKIRTMR